MKKIFIIAVITLVSCLSFGIYAQSKPVSPAYRFGRNGISREVLENYLDRSITMVYFLSPCIPEAKRIYPYADDDVRMIKNIGAKFLGRAIYRWGGESLLNDAEFLNTAAERMKRMHEYDPDMVFQACLFEIITTDVDNVPIPEWVFRDFGLPVEKRNFSYKAMFGKTSANCPPSSNSN
ncbi:hypothetical protein FACS189451_10270 [Bacteroidia bacterium]|nr:hypothetical protein FACS189451_10270 [Bacteroidia bacterium]